MELSMSDQLPMFEPETSPDSANGISSPALESGPTPCASPDGQTTGRSLPQAAPASRSRLRGNAKAPPMSGIFGPNLLDSCGKFDLSWRLASRLAVVTASLGSTMFSMIWKGSRTPRGRLIPRLAATGLRTSDRASTGQLGWPTPQASDTTGGGQAKRSDGRSNLVDFAMLAGWPTPTACSPNSLRGKGQDPAKRAEGGHSINLQDMVTLTGWPSPQSRDWKSGETGGVPLDHNARPLSEIAVLAGWATPNVPNGGRISGNPSDIGKKRDGTKAQIGLENQARLTGWATPTKADGERGSESYCRGNLTLLGQAWLTAFGPGPIGYLLGPSGWEIVPASGQLRPAFSLWLMGLPDEFWLCAERATASLRLKRRPSSKRAPKSGG